ncbi:phage terminase large subunit [Dysosmobacter sp.]|uniref:phage terminase large subunit n=1 Tax=Dysosmobacter sp. TaxID=2591382 RepID=UPI002A98FD50|nr:phage terminase large subunit [Dysosmobacter sp.]MDY5509517.1 phage terminase large subunit [Dysosmobacter sp.]
MANKTVKKRNPETPTSETPIVSAPEDQGFLDQESLSDREYLTRELSRRELARRSYRRYLYYVHGQAWRRTRMSDYLADEVQRFVEADTGHPYDILLIETPPQHGKSITITESFPSWYLGKYPKNRVIEASYNDDTAKRFGRKNLEKVETFGASLFSFGKGSIWTNTEFELSNGWGRMISRGVMSGITGNPANLLLIDDPIKNREEADSATYRDKLWGEWQNTLKSRLAAGAKVIVIMTPWHEDDLASRLLANEPHIRLLRLPVEAEEHDPLGRAVGDALAPELGKDNTWLRQFKGGYVNDPSKGGLRAWQALYQCSPRVEGGNLVRREWWKYYDPKEVSFFPTTVISVDAAFKDKETSDYVAIQVWGKRGIDYYLRYSMNKHLDFPGTVQNIRLLKRLFPETTYILVEDKANGSAVIQTLQHEFVGVIGITPKGGKVSRVNAVSPAIESGHVFLPMGELWTEEFIDQFTAFPAGQHDDMVDACSQCLGFLLYSSGTTGVLPDRRQQLLEEQLQQEQEAFLDGSLYDIYGPTGGLY